MNNTEVKTLVDSIKEVDSRTPITSRYGDMIIYRGEHFTMGGGMALGERHEFRYSDPKSLLNGLLRLGLMLNGSEQNRVLKIYEKRVQAGLSLTL